MIRFEFDPEKGLESLTYVATHLRDVYKALKALYIADKLHLARYGRFIYGETYSALPFGPVPQNAYDAVKVLRGEISRSFVPDNLLRSKLARFGNELIVQTPADLDLLSRSDVECLDEAIRDVVFDSFDQVKSKTHDTAYNKTRHCAAMAVEDIIEALPEERRAPVLKYLQQS